MKCLVTIFLSVLLNISFSYGQKPEMVVNSGHTDAISCLDVSRDGRWMATGGMDKIIKIVDVSSGKEFRTISGLNGRINYIKFDDDSKILGAATSDGEMKFWDVVSGELLSEYRINDTENQISYILGNSMVSYVSNEGKLSKAPFKETGTEVPFDIVGCVRQMGSYDGKYMFTYDYQGIVHKVDASNGNELASNKLFEKMLFSPTRMDIDPSGKYLAMSLASHEIYILKTSDLSLHKKLVGHDNVIKDIKFDEKSGELLSANRGSKELYVWNVEKGELIDKYPFDEAFSLDWVESSPKYNLILIAAWKQILYVDAKTKNVVRIFTSKANKIVNMSYDQRGKYLAVASDDVSVKLWDLEQNKIVRNFQGFWPVAISPNGKHLVSNYMSIKLAVWDINSGEKLGELPTNGDLIQQIAFSRDGNKIAGIGIRGKVFIWDIASMKIDRTIDWPPGMSYGICFSPNGSKVVASGLGNSFYVWDVKTGEQLAYKDGYMLMFSGIVFTPDGKYMAASNWDQKVYVFDAQTWEEVAVIEGHKNIVTCIDISYDGKYLATGSGNNSVKEADNSVIVWDFETKTELCRYTGHTGIINKVVFDRQATQIYSCANDGMVKVWDYLECSEKGTYVSVNQKDYVVATPEHYYMASKDALDAVSFRIEDHVYPFDQFDLLLNRPDLVSKKLGKTPEGLVNAYEYIYKKRLKQMDFKESELELDFHLPEVEILTKDIQLVTEKSQVSFKARFSDSKYTLDRIKVYVNDVPVYGQEGISLRGQKTNKLEQELNIDLAAGSNVIKVSVLNSNGVESLKKSVSVIRNTEKSEGDLYLVSLGVSKYQNEQFNLKYAAKDAHDIQEKLGAADELYKSIKTLELTDSMVTKESIMGISKFLESANAGDAIILFVAGHGVLDEKYQYYFCTHDMDFENPAKNGVPYDVFESILVGTKSLKKLLIMDTCHSGEVDEDEIEKTEETETSDGDIKFRGVAQNFKKKNAFGAYNTSVLMENMFSDIRKKSGANVISSAGGAEYAMESDEWQNGLFTFCLLSGLKNNKADQNMDRQIMISELRHYVYEEVLRLSNGKQMPTSREENISVDYRLK